MSTVDFVTSLVDKFAELVAEKVKATIDVSKYDNTIGNLPAILKNLSDRQQKLEDKFDQLNGASDDRLDEYVKNSDVVSGLIDYMIDDALGKYEPAEHLDFDDLLNNSYALEDKIKDEVRSLDWSVEVRVR